MIDWLRKEAASPSVALADGEVPVAIRRHPSAKRMTMRLAPDGGEVRITIPRWGRTAEALDFARSKRDWLEAELARILAARMPLVPGGSIRYRGSELAISWSAQAPRGPMLRDGALHIGGPEDNLPARLQRWLENEAAALLQEDLAFYCGRAGVPQPRLRLSRARRRWGSCAGDGTIRINWRLVQAADAVRRSVVAHEVAHLVHFDHGPAFHALLREIYEGEIRSADRWLKEHGRGLYAQFG